MFEYYNIIVFYNKNNYRVNFNIYIFIKNKTKNIIK